jgi:hypothetical protein
VTKKCPITNHWRGVHRWRRTARGWLRGDGSGHEAALGHPEGFAPDRRSCTPIYHQANAPLVRCYAPWDSLFARKFSLLWGLGNSVRN